jgi:hypothetical protein
MARVRHSSGSASAGAELVVGPSGQTQAPLESCAYPPAGAASCIRVGRVGRAGHFSADLGLQRMSWIEVSTTVPFGESN